MFTLLESAICVDGKPHLIRITRWKKFVQYPGLHLQSQKRCLTILAGLTRRSFLPMLKILISPGVCGSGETSVYMPPTQLCIMIIRTDFERTTSSESSATDITH